MPLHADVFAMDLHDVGLLYHAICDYGSDGCGICVNFFADTHSVDTFCAATYPYDCLYVVDILADTSSNGRYLAVGYCHADDMHWRGFGLE